MKITNIPAIMVLTTLVISVSLLGCEKDDFGSIPVCLAEQIEFISRLHCEGNAGIVKYLFQDRAVYYVNPGHCYDDQVNAIMNSNCQVIGYIGGGFTVINGIDFFENAIFIRVVWEK